MDPLVALTALAVRLIFFRRGQHQTALETMRNLHNDIHIASFKLLHACSEVRNPGHKIETVRRPDVRHYAARRPRMVHIHDGDIDIIDLRGYGETEEHHEHDRDKNHDEHRSPVSQYMQRLFLDKRMEIAFHLFGTVYVRLAPRASIRNTSSIDAAPNCSFSRDGVSMAHILPSTIIDTREQYSASSI